MTFSQEKCSVVLDGSMEEPNSKVKSGSGRDGARPDNNSNEIFTLHRSVHPTRADPHSDSVFHFSSSLRSMRGKEKLFSQNCYRFAFGSGEKGAELIGHFQHVRYFE
jgi:hypothetical protein